ncbi:MAG: hypothetical protein GXP03_15425 [Alphaproteobacteria bacterium]|nr:hypothetical protein [Alphaproteobacteria bacterium]
MPFENLKAGIALLIEQMTDNPEDAHQIQESLREKLAELRGLGLPLPDDLVALEAQLERDLSKAHRP